MTQPPPLTHDTMLERFLASTRHMYEGYLERANKPDAATYEPALTPTFMLAVQHELAMIRDVQAFVSEWKEKQ